jgi:hypothetical protein
MTPAEAITSPAVLGPYFAGPSWETWRAVLKAAYAQPLTEAELTLFRSVAGDRNPPQRQVRELIVIAGRRSGKDSIASACATAAAMQDYSPYLRPGERASVLCLAVDRQQARIVSRYIAGYFGQVPLLAPLKARETDDGLELDNGVEVLVSSNSYRAVRGKTICCAIFDEAAFWRSEESANPDAAVYQAVLPGLATLPGAILIVITTAYRRSGIAYEAWKNYFGKDDDEVLVVYGPTPAFNPTLPQSVIEAALARDPEAASAEYLSQWRDDLSGFLDRELVDAAVDKGVVVRPPSPTWAYQAFADPSGGRGDSFTLGISHADGEKAVLDALYERRAPFNPSEVVAEVVALLQSYRLGVVVGDHYTAEWVVEAFRKEGVEYLQSERDRSAIYLDALPLFTPGRVRLLDNQRLANQLASLERRTSRVGRDRVDHPPGSHDDLANAAAGALVLVSGETDRGLIEYRVAHGGGHDQDYHRLVAGEAVVLSSVPYAAPPPVADPTVPFTPVPRSSRELPHSPPATLERTTYHDHHPPRRSLRRPRRHQRRRGRPRRNSDDPGRARGLEHPDFARERPARHPQPSPRGGHVRVLEGSKRRRLRHAGGPKHQRGRALWLSGRRRPPQRPRLRWAVERRQGRGRGGR